MSYFIVAYDRKPGVDYKPLHEILESYPEHWHLQQSLWIVGPAVGALVVAEEVNRALDADDLLFVQELTLESAWNGYTADGNQWIGDRALQGGR